VDEPIRLITSKSQLRGTCYFEFAPGKYTKSWGDNSVFLAEEVFALIEPAFERVPDYDHYAFVNIPREEWQAILSDIANLRSKAAAAKSIDDLRDVLGFFFTTSEMTFAADFDANVLALQKLIDELTIWIKNTLRHHEFISVLGM